MQLEVVYCESRQQTCVAVAVPIKFPYHCDDGEKRQTLLRRQPQHNVDSFTTSTISQHDNRILTPSPVENLERSTQL